MVFPANLAVNDETTSSATKTTIHHEHKDTRGPFIVAYQKLTGRGC